jgi:hypothetical protein
MTIDIIMGYTFGTGCTFGAHCKYPPLEIEPGSLTTGSKQVGPVRHGVNTVR